MNDLAMTSQGGEAMSGDDLSAGYGGGAPAYESPGRSPRNEFASGSSDFGDDGSDFDEAALDAALEDAEAGDRYEDPALDPYGEGEVEEVEHEGKRYRIPKALKGAVMMHGDYTRKTQELAQGRRALDSERAAFAQEAQAQTQFDQQFAGEMGRYTTLSHQVDALEGADWQGLAARDPEQAARLQQTYFELRAERDGLVERIDFVQRQRAAQAQHEHARSLDHAHAVLSRELPEWSAQAAEQLANFGEHTFGYSRAELDAVMDPRMIKTLHLAMLGHQAQEQSRAQAQTARRIAGGQRTAPAQTLRGRSARFPATADTHDFAAFESLADERMRIRR